jgi:predicted transcriptional regulator
MSTGAITVSENTLARDVAHLMHPKKVKQVPVVVADSPIWRISKPFSTERTHRSGY